ncbi:YgjP-like metallopeptidase domain-containing protein [Mycoplasma phocoeninasale]|uniref:YgjP-like metallopeptidase domain-containing protein n=1 Tax=Mycoplasma phocoeninasale TaxID=2726117 RepID=UPI0019675BCA|nr:YgjP-like metallopeptidase domain-containing protein [Mycoplasma phocoeninasale]MBN0970892.1 DUF45 domain-containing protein [Mycoplasma phocoeninasale]
MRKINEILIYKLGEKEINIHLRFTNNKNIYLTMKNDQIILSTPVKYINTEQLNNFLAMAIPKLIKRSGKQKSKPVLGIDWENQQFYLFGKLTKFKIFDGFIQLFIDESIEIIYTKTKSISPLKKLIWNNLTQKLEKIFSEWANYYSQKYLKKPLLAKIRIADKRSAWATNYLTKDTISVSKYLIFYNIRCIKYVAMHEIAHFLEGNHSNRFWKIISQEFPDYKEIIKAMNEHKFMWEGS